MNGTKLIRVCEVGYKVLHSFDEDGFTTIDDLIDDEIFENILKEEKVSHLYIARFKNNYLEDIISTVFAPMNISEEDREEFEFDYDWDIDIPFSGTAYELQRHINGKVWCENYHGKSI